MQNGTKVVIASAVRTPMGRAIKGTLAFTRPDDLAALVLLEAVRRAGIEPSHVEDVVLGCAIPEAEQGLNIARMAALLAGFPDHVPGVTVNRFCASGLQAIAMGAQSIATGAADVVVAGGVESMSLIPMTSNKFSANMRLLDAKPGAYLGMGQTAENVAQKYNVSRQDQDEFALQSHTRAAAAQDAGRFKDETVAVPVRVDTRRGTEVQSRTVEFATDELVRRDTNLDALGQLRPSFHPKGSVTPGNSSPLTDGASAVVLMSEARARALGVKPLGEFVNFSVAGVAPDLMGIGPVEAVPKALHRAGITLNDVKVIELNEAFAAQALAVIRELKLPTDRTNPNGGAIALGHPLGCTGARLTTTALYELQRQGGGYGLITMCIGGGQGAAGLIRVN